MISSVSTWVCKLHMHVIEMRRNLYDVVFIYLIDVFVNIIKLTNICQLLLSCLSRRLIDWMSPTMIQNQRKYINLIRNLAKTSLLKNNKYNKYNVTSVSKESLSILTQAPSATRILAYIYYFYLIFIQIIFVDNTFSTIIKIILLW